MAIRVLSPFQFCLLLPTPNSIPTPRVPVEPNPAFRYADLQYIRNMFTGKAEVRETEVEGETLTFRYREIDPGGSLILQDVAIMTGVVYNLKHERANDTLIKATEEGRLEEYLQVLKNNQEHQSKVISLGLELPIAQVDETITDPLVRTRLANAIKGGAVPRLSTDEPTDVDTFPEQIEGQEPTDTASEGGSP